MWLKKKNGYGHDIWGDLYMTNDLKTDHDIAS